MSWINSYPKRASKNDLTGKSLSILSDRPPESSNIKGMSSLIIIDDESKKYQVLVTAKDIESIIQIVQQNERFTFDDSRPYAEVVRAEVK